MERNGRKLITRYRRRKAERDYRIREEWRAMTADAENSRVEVANALADKYSVSLGTIYAVVKKGRDGR